MKIDVYDTYATPSGRDTIHFDVFLPHGENVEKAFETAQQWLSSIGENPEGLKQSRCNFCHSEMARPDIAKEIEEKGYFILQMEGCPNPFR